MRAQRTVWLCLVMLTGTTLWAEEIRLSRRPCGLSTRAEMALAAPFQSVRIDQLDVGLALTQLGHGLGCRVVVEAVPVPGVTDAQLARRVDITLANTTLRGLLDKLVEANPVFRWWVDEDDAVHVAPRAAEAADSYLMTKPVALGGPFDMTDERAVESLARHIIEQALPRYPGQVNWQGPVPQPLPQRHFRLRLRSPNLRSLLGQTAAKMGRCYAVLVDGRGYGQFVYGDGPRMSSGRGTASALRPAKWFMDDLDDGSEFFGGFDKGAPPAGPALAQDVPSWAVPLAIQRRCRTYLALERLPSATTSLADLDRPVTIQVRRHVHSSMDISDDVIPANRALDSRGGQYAPAGVAADPRYPLTQPLPAFSLTAQSPSGAVEALAKALSARTGLRFEGRVTDTWLDPDGDPVYLDWEPATLTARDVLDRLRRTLRCASLVAPLPNGEGYGIWLGSQLPLDPDLEKRIVFGPQP